MTWIDVAIFFCTTNLVNNLSQLHHTVSIPNGVVNIILRLLSNLPDPSDAGSDFVVVDDKIPVPRISEDFLELESGDFSMLISNKTQFETIMRCINTATSFRAISCLFVIFGEAIGSLKLGKPSEEDVARTIRKIVAINLSALRSILTHVWGFSILVDGATHRSNGYFDMRISFEVDCCIHNVHLLAIQWAVRRTQHQAMPTSS